MAGFNGRGPQDMGPISGRGRGWCNNAGTGPGAPYGAAGFGGRRGFGGGRCFGRRAGQYPASGEAAFRPAPADELEDLKSRAGSLKEMLEGMVRRIDELQKEKE